MNAEPYFLKTERLGFRKWSEEDIDLAMGLWGDYEVTKLFDSRGALSEKQVRERLRKEIDNQRKWGVQYWPIFLLKSHEHVGACGLRSHAYNVYELGFHIRSDKWGQGYATEAARAVIRYAFVDLEVDGLFAGHHPKNDASRHLLFKLGFRYNDDEFYEPTGLMHPSYLLTEEEFTR